MKKLTIITIFILLSGFLYSQTFRPGLAYARIPDLNINGFKMANHFLIPTESVNLDIGFEFLLGRGNPNVVYSDSMNYNLAIFKSYLGFLVGLIPMTTNIKQFQASFGISRDFSLGKHGFIVAGGGYLSHTSSHSLIGPFKETDVYFFLGLDSIGNPVVIDHTKWDVMFPVNLRYLNAGMYLGAEWMLLKNIKTPVGIELMYYAGLKRKHFVTFGVNFHLPVK